MLLSFGLILLCGFGAGKLAEKLHLPPLVGMLAAGILLSSQCLGWLDETILGISADIRKMALAIILLKAGLSLNTKDLLRVGRPAFLLAFLPATFELAAYLLLAPLFFAIDWQSAALMGAVMSAVSPAVVVPRMSAMIEKKEGTQKKIPQMILAGASLDDVYVIVLFTAFLSMNVGGTFSWTELLRVPLSILTGICCGFLCGIGLQKLKIGQSHSSFSAASQMVLLLAISFLLYGLEQKLDGSLPFSGLLAILAMALTAAEKMNPHGLHQLKTACSSLWNGAEILLFVLVGAAVQVRFALQAGPALLVLLFLALLIRAVGVWLCLVKTALTAKEKLFCIFSYLPKATVQAAIGSIPLAMHLSAGSLILSAAVTGILVTAPVGAVLIDWGRKKLLSGN